jgi:hypothetical protein
MNCGGVLLGLTAFAPGVPAGENTAVEPGAGQYGAGASSLKDWNKRCAKVVPKNAPAVKHGR